MSAETVETDAQGSEIDLLCLSEPPRTIVLTESRGAMELPGSEANAHLDGDSAACVQVLETVLEPALTSLDHYATGCLDHLAQACRTFGPCWMSSLFYAVVTDFACYINCFHYNCW